jgi:hypothetical protein
MALAHHRIKLCNARDNNDANSMMQGLLREGVEVETGAALAAVVTGTLVAADRQQSTNSGSVSGSSRNRSRGNGNLGSVAATAVVTLADNIPQAGIVALIAMALSSSSMCRHPSHHCNDLVALVVMALLPLMHRHLCSHHNGNCCPQCDGFSAVVELA